MSRKVLVLGATSAIAQAVCRQLLERGDSLFLVGRNATKLQAIQADLQGRGAKSVATWVTDLNDSSRFEELVRTAHSQMGGIDVAFLAQGVLGNQKQAQASTSEARDILETNFVAPALLLERVAQIFESQKSGSIAAITSVAGDRGRQSNYFYGSAKGGLNLYLAGLRNRLAKQDVSVTTLKLGFVDTPMTRDFKKGPLWASPDQVARGIIRAIDRKKDVVYLPFFWRGIMWIIRSIPERVFKRLSL